MGRIAVALIVSSWIMPISILVNHIVPEPYMDEIFHVPQAQQYCLGNFRSWDPMITTPPGLYFFSLAYVASLFPGMLFIKPTSSFINACSTSVLRSTNGLLAVICSVLVYDIIKCLQPSLNDRKATFYAVVLALYPLHWFFTFLYYTDVASLTLVLAMYLMCLKKNYLSSALLGGVAVLVRQTNIIWMLFVACTGVLDVIQAKQKREESLLSEIKDDYLASSKGVNISSNLKKRRSSNAIAITSHSVDGTGLPSRFDSSSGLFSEIWSILLASWHMKWELIVSFSPFFALLIAFAAFVVWNGSVVLGAKEAHTVSPHFAQLLYYSLVSCCFMAPVHFTTIQAANLAMLFWKNRPISFLLSFLATVFCFLSVHYFGIAHPYLLADNRHYPFYIWRKLINAHWSTRYLLVPLYVYSWISILCMLVKAQKKVWVLAYFLASAAVLIPTPLIEFRYYTIAFFFLILHSHVTNDRVWILMGIIYISINIFTMAMFLFRPFHWNHEPGIQRFIW
ncbi:dol-P-Glc:Glc(2)Man(9)GlcNAc(2)-PP-Dol alpha-1,2-glucosyltransferase-like [Rutidosis leptorrhynchoides]|uniref:dol-P-Glc:Glc(2)Man(9)GlcNAc(2)-PP-Dol alpha-1,2-glucosyltransferase-like n=1 Tax=Rutidosis leptorrhynchoides TaxID=125765 RepID=UPI003A996003